MIGGPPLPLTSASPGGNTTRPSSDSGTLVGGINRPYLATITVELTMATAVEVPPNGLVAVSRAVVSAAAELAATVERAVVGDARVRTARGNAWEAICADRARARARDDMERLVRSLLADGPRSGVRPAPRTAQPPGTGRPDGAAPPAVRRGHARSGAMASR
jgi:hypothetical protein